MLGAELVWFAGRGQRIRQQQETSGLSRLFWAEHAGLPSTVGEAAEKDTARGYDFDGCDCILQSGAIALGFTRSRRAVGSILTVRQIATQDQGAGFGKSFRQSDQQRSLAIRSSAVSEHESVAVGIARAV